MSLFGCPVRTSNSSSDEGYFHHSTRLGGSAKRLTVTDKSRGPVADERPWTIVEAEASQID